MCGGGPKVETPTQAQAPQVNSAAATLAKERVRAAMANFGSLSNVKTSSAGALSPGGRVGG